MAQGYFIKEFGANGSVIGHFTRESIEGYWFYEGYSIGGLDSLEISHVPDGTDEIDEDEIESLDVPSAATFEKAKSIWENTLSRVKSVTSEGDLDDEDSLEVNWFVGHENEEQIRDIITDGIYELRHLLENRTVDVYCINTKSNLTITVRKDSLDTILEKFENFLFDRIVSISSSVELKRFWDENLMFRIINTKSRKVLEEQYID